MKTSIIVCTHNKEDTILTVVASCCKHNPDAEVIVVDDGSTDGTEIVLSTLATHYRFEYLKLPENHGKSYAMACGVEYASNDIVLFVNVNLVGLRKKHFEAMLAPIQNEQADMVVGNPTSFTIDYSANPYETAMGEKAMLRADLLPILKDIKEIFFGVEAFLNIYFQAVGKRVCYQTLNDLERVGCNADSKSEAVRPAANKEIANALISNFDLMMKRVQNNIQNSQNYTQSTISSVQLQLNKYMKHLQERVNPTST